MIYADLSSRIRVPYIELNCKLMQLA